MRITLISTSNKQDKGPRIIASFLEKNKHQVEILYSPAKPNCKDSGWFPLMFLLVKRLQR